MSITDKAAETRPAIPDDPLPLPGESLGRERDNLLHEHAYPWIMIAACAVGFAVNEWVRLFLHSPINIQSAIGISVLALIVLGLCVRRTQRVFIVTRALKLGMRAEQHVSQYLKSECVALGYKLFDDIPATTFNIDHVLIGPAGILVIETKYRTKPPTGIKAELHFDGHSTLTFPDGCFDTACVAQSKANADYVRRLLEKRAARDSLCAIPVLILPGWWINDSTPRPRPIWIIGDDTLHKWLKTEPQRLSVSEIASLSAELTNYIRNFKK